MPALFKCITKTWIYHIHGIIDIIVNISSPVFFYNTGLIPSDKESATFPLCKKGGGNAVVIAVGGAPEALDAHPGTFNVLLAKKKGFIKMAMEYG